MKKQECDEKGQRTVVAVSGCGLYIRDGGVFDDQIDIPFQKVHGIHKDKLSGRLAVDVVAAIEINVIGGLDDIEDIHGVFHDVFGLEDHVTGEIRDQNFQSTGSGKIFNEILHGSVHVELLGVRIVFRGVPCILPHFIRYVFFFLIPKIIEHPLGNVFSRRGDVIDSLFIGDGLLIGHFSGHIEGDVIGEKG